ncbi:hypothetical protein CCAX7_43860 [Capsulimonas corticalis]|uniref:Uncharacterized protein n=1 Tax=Capsulimonas corticalis TaxID=2219043 RepID=A0A402CXH2_9BACT|nr:DUF2723 domain-containing protein [Capsulimonas corticalis]BDI32335.1 hypothetical protein CCAX7_43860 [Capsulimonas corticalis]
MIFPLKAHIQDRWVAAALFAMAFFVYLRTLCPTIYWGDCGELATAAYSLGVTHPTGYPVWCLLAKLWTLILPVGAPIWRLNVLSALFGALAIPCLYGFSRSVGASRVVAAAAAGMFAFSLTFWQQCLFCETYSLTAFYTSLLLFLAARWRTRGCQTRDLRMLALVYGFALTNHQTNTLFLPGFLAFILMTKPALLRLRDQETRRKWTSTIAMGLAPLLFYAYLPIRASAHPAANWGGVTSPFAFWFHVTGRQYSDAMFHSSLHDVMLQLSAWYFGLGRELTWAGATLALAGLIVLWSRRDHRPLAILLSWVILADVFYTVNYGIYNAYIYFIPCYISMSLAAGFAMTAAWDVIQRGVEPSKHVAFATLAAACALAITPFQAMRHWTLNDLSHNWTCYDYGRNLLATIPRGGVLIDFGRDTSDSAISYLQHVEGRRLDVTLVKRGMLAGIYDKVYHRWVCGWYLTQVTQGDRDMASIFPADSVTIRQATREEPLRRIITHCLAVNRPLYFLGAMDGPPIHLERDKTITVRDYLEKTASIAQIGLLLEIFPHDRRPAPPVLLAETKRVWRNYSLRGVYDGMYVTDDFLTNMALDYVNGEIARGRIAFLSGDWDEAEIAYRHVLRLFKSREAEDTLQRIAELRGQPMKTAMSAQASVN